VRKSKSDSGSPKGGISADSRLALSHVSGDQPTPLFCRYSRRFKRGSEGHRPESVSKPKVCERSEPESKSLICGSRLAYSHTSTSSQLLNNPDFKVVKFDHFRIQAGLPTIHEIKVHTQKKRYPFPPRILGEGA
jgi:hypothetical protein